MFVRKSKYDSKLEIIKSLNWDVEYWSTKWAKLDLRYDRSVAKYNKLVRLINEKGGQSFLDGDNKSLNKTDIDKMIRLCHPDKHDGKQSAVEVTQLLLNMRKQL